MWEKLITCDKYTGTWMSCHFCQAVCEQKHFSNAVILAVDLPNQRPMHKLASAHTKRHKTKPCIPRHWQNMTAYKKCKVHKHWHWWRAVSRVKHCTFSAIMTSSSGETAVWTDRHSSFWAPCTAAIVPGTLTNTGFESFIYLLNALQQHAQNS